MARRHCRRSNHHRTRPATRPPIRPRMERTLGVLRLDGALELWRSRWKVMPLNFDDIQRKSLRDNSKAPSSRSTPEVAFIAPREVSRSRDRRGFLYDVLRMLGFPHAER